MIYTDGLFKKGASHLVCEDYVLHGSLPIPFVVLCDGCSGSKHSDVGARLLAHSIPKVLSSLNSEEIINLSAEEFTISVYQQARIATLSLGLDKEALNATLLVAMHDPVTNNTRIIMVGDGVLSIKEKDISAASVMQIDFSNDYPAYPGYFADKILFKKYEDITSKLNQKYTLNWLVGKKPMLSNEVEHNYIYEIIVPSNSIEWLMLSSDGLDTFVEKELPNRSQNMKDLVIPSFVDIKKSQGNFVSRRINRMLRIELDDFIHQDDLSVVGMSFVLEVNNESKS